jgi:GT2 family glycosyltransferase
MAECEPSSPSDHPSLSVVVPTHNGLAVLKECLASVLRYRPARTEVIVVDDASRDGTADWLTVAHPEVRLIRLRRNGGFCVAINAGIRAARADVVQTLNNDTVVTPGWGEAALALFADPTVGSVAPLVWLLDRDGEVDSAGDQYHLCGWAMNRGHGQQLGPELRQVTEVLGASASAGFFRREALLRVGLFPEHFRAYLDDVDVAFRLRAAGYRSLFTPNARVFHRLHYSHDCQAPALITQAALNEERVFWGNMPAGLLLAGLLPHLGYVGCRFLMRCLQRQHPLAYLRGKLQILGEWRRVLTQRAWVRCLRRGHGARARFPVLVSLRPFLQRLGRSLVRRSDSFARPVTQQAQ